ncbi:N-terminal asparagine amidohydrolase-domain-containing protein [Haematococcus lacustris]
MDATTCMLMALRCPVTQRAFIAHHDNITCCSPPSQLLACLQSFTKPELYLVGSYTEDSGISLATYHTLLTALHHHTRQPITLRLACFGPANTDARGAPRTRDVALACQSGLARPAPFVDRGPQLPRRFATASPRARSIAVHSHPGYILLPRANIQLTSWAVMAEERLLQLDDDELVQAVSTSPLHEPSHFAADIRAAHRWKLSTANQDLEAACFTWQGAGRDEEAGTAWAPCTPPEGLQESISSLDCIRDVELAFVG